MVIDRHASHRSIIAFMMTTVLMAGCAAAAVPAVAAAAQARIIVQFRPGTPDPADPAFRTRIAAAAEVGGIELIRPMSGNAWVMMLDCTDPRARLQAADVDACARALQRLAATEWVLHVEPDARASHQ